MTTRNDDIIWRQIALLPSGSNTATSCLFIIFGSDSSFSVIEHWSRRLVAKHPSNWARIHWPEFQLSSYSSYLTGHSNYSFWWRHVIISRILICEGQHGGRTGGAAALLRVPRRQRDVDHRRPVPRRRCHSGVSRPGPGLVGPARRSSQLLPAGRFVVRLPHRPVLSGFGQPHHAGHAPRPRRHVRPQRHHLRHSGAEIPGQADSYGTRT